MNEEFYDRIFEQYKRSEPIESEMVDWWEPHGKYQIKIRLTNGRTLLYHYLMDASRTVFDNDMSDDSIRREFSANLGRRMFELGINQGELSGMTGISQTAISRYIKKERTPTLTAVVKIADALKCSVYDLIEY